MESNGGSCRSKLRHDEVVTSVVLYHRQKVGRKISELFLEIRAKEVVNGSRYIEIVIIHHIYPHRGDRRKCLVDMYDLNIGIRALIVSKKLVVFITASRYCQVGSAVIVLCGVY